MPDIINIIDNEPLWIPSVEQILNSNMTKYMNFVNDKYYFKFIDYEELYDWSINEIEDFWESIWEFAGIIHSKSYNNVLLERKMPGAIWFEGAQLNFAENLLKFRDDSIAIIHIQERAETLKITYKELYSKVAVFASGLKKNGVKPGDKVCAYISNIPEAVIAMLATTSMGAIWSSTSPDFGLQGVLDRFGQINPKILIAVNGYTYNGTDYDCMEKIKEITNQLDDLSKVVIIPKIQSNVTLSSKDIYWEDFVDNNSDKIEFEQLPFSHPIYIMFSSGTTGVPKCIVHSAGGTLLQHFKELSLHTNLNRKDIIMYFTTCGWMMWNWLVSSLNIGASVVLYDGSPTFPHPAILWKQVEKEKINIFGTSPKFLSFCRKGNISPKETFDLSSLNTILSTGSPLSDNDFRWVYSDIKEALRLSSISGGTDIISCFMLGNPNLPVYTEEIQCRGLGMKVEAWDEKGNSVIDEKGELVCTLPFVSMPIYFLNDPDNETYFNSYFNFYKGVWRHGDYISISNNGGVVVYGRSDAILNPGGVRIGTAEIYRVVEGIQEISDSIVVGQPKDNDIRVVLFVVLKPGFELTNELDKKIRNKIREELTPRHLPQIIKQIMEVPVTLNGKKVEIAVSKILNGEQIPNMSALLNPLSLTQFEGIL